eukprot:TRINITY_DN14431_c0_g1_i4.p1 TRINITY_DN14431_c0_g1~~TRINITY_DN14431_c0_g1_i4.p1  ORF type:complete len:1063 (+),score=144.91 TRINITY_DN14431_c0_g1_i4:82-3270(+)
MRPSRLCSEDVGQAAPVLPISGRQSLTGGVSTDNPCVVATANGNYARDTTGVCTPMWSPISCARDDGQAAPVLPISFATHSGRQSLTGGVPTDSPCVVATANGNYARGTTGVCTPMQSPISCAREIGQTACGKMSAGDVMRQGRNSVGCCRDYGGLFPPGHTTVGCGTNSVSGSVCPSRSPVSRRRDGLVVQRREGRHTVGFPPGHTTVGCGTNSVSGSVCPSRSPVSRRRDGLAVQRKEACQMAVSLAPSNVAVRRGRHSVCGHVGKSGGPSLCGGSASFNAGIEGINSPLSSQVCRLQELSVIQETGPNAVVKAVANVAMSRTRHSLGGAGAKGCITNGSPRRSDQNTSCHAGRAVGGTAVYAPASPPQHFAVVQGHRGSESCGANVGVGRDFMPPNRLRLGSAAMSPQVCCVNRVSQPTTVRQGTGSVPCPRPVPPPTESTVSVRSPSKQFVKLCTVVPGTVLHSVAARHGVPSISPGAPLGRCASTTLADGFGRTVGPRFANTTVPAKSSVALPVRKVILSRAYSANWPRSETLSPVHRRRSVEPQGMCSDGRVHVQVAAEAAACSPLTGQGVCSDGCVHVQVAAEAAACSPLSGQTLSPVHRRHSAEVCPDGRVLVQVAAEAAACSPLTGQGFKSPTKSSLTPTLKASGGTVETPPRAVSSLRGPAAPLSPSLRRCNSTKIVQVQSSATGSADFVRSATEGIDTGEVKPSSGFSNTRLDVSDGPGAPLTSTALPMPVNGRISTPPVARRPPKRNCDASTALRVWLDGEKPADKRQADEGSATTASPSMPSFRGRDNLDCSAVDIPASASPSVESPRALWENDVIDDVEPFFASAAVAAAEPVESVERNDEELLAAVTLPDATVARGATDDVEKTSKESSPVNAKTKSVTSENNDVMEERRAEGIEVGDIVKLSIGEFRGHRAAVMQVHEGHCTAVVLDEDGSRGVAESWPNLKDVVVTSTSLRLGSEVVVAGLRSAKASRFNGAVGVIVLHSKQGHPCFVQKGGTQEEARLVVCVELKVPGEEKQTQMLLEPKFLFPRVEYLLRLAEDLRELAEDSS